MKKILIPLFLVFLGIPLVAQPVKKAIEAETARQSIKIDGMLDEPEWNHASPATEFVQRTPYNGQPATFRTEVRFLYDNSGLYVGAMMYDPSPDSIPMQMGLRDAHGINADNLILVLSPFNDGINAFCFMVTSSDVQSDFKLTVTNGDDFTWDAVWQSKARLCDSGWVAEFKIPYSAIRFPQTSEQQWGLNCQREIRRYREVSTWNLIDAKVSGYVNQCGVLDGIRDIKPPLRLSVTPYVSGYLQNSAGESAYDFTYNYGADLKYGLNESFTLDMTLIPDFGQVRSDDKVYNFSPFEIMYDERRQFFTEGTELFNKGGIFYSRRVGSEPKGYNDAYDELTEQEVITDNPTQTKLINATKISGRTPKGLGIGVFNAMSANTWATATDTVTGITRKILTQGFTNYNTIVLDQNLKNNSYVDFLNTNYFMPTEGYTANVTGTTFKFANKKFTYALTGSGFVSQKYFSHDAPEFGYKYSLGFGKISGNFKFNVGQLLETDTYDPNDMGFNPQNNRFNNYVYFIYNIYDPFWKLLNWYNFFEVDYHCLYEGFDYTSLEFHLESNTTTKKHLSLGINSDFSPIESHDYYEPRVDGRMYIAPAYGNLSFWYSSDYRKPFALDGHFSGYIAPSIKSSGYSFSLEPRIRVSKRLFIEYEFELEDIQNDIGYVMDSITPAGQEAIIFGRRDRWSVTNVLEGNYMITSNMSIDLRARHYWVAAPYYSYFLLEEDGHLTPANYSGDPDVNFNLFNIDLGFIWNFAPGSQISVMWKNAINTYDNDVATSFFDDFSRTITSPAANSFSVRVLYYLDALYFKKKSPTG